MIKGEFSVDYYGNIFKDGDFWIASIPVLDAMTQGMTLKEVQDMAIDLVKSLMDDYEIDVVINLISRYSSDGFVFEMIGSDSNKMLNLILKRQKLYIGKILKVEK